MIFQKEETHENRHVQFIAHIGLWPDGVCPSRLLKKRRLICCKACIVCCLSATV